MSTAFKLAVLISGRGSNMVAIAHACRERRLQAQLSVVIADRDCPGLALAHSLGVRAQPQPAPAHPPRAPVAGARHTHIDASGAALVVLAGFMRVLSPAFVAHYAGHLLNIHPSLLPSYKGLHTHQRVLEAGERQHGASVHFVTGELDGGPLIFQVRVPVHEGDTEHSLSARVQRQEHKIYPHVIGLIADGRLQLRGSTVLLDGQALDTPITEDADNADAPLSV
jgi:phosphoribosylglycinamide formyltransferase-1